MIENTLMIHQIEKNFFDLNLSEYKLTFDDGLYAHHYYYPLFKSFNTEMIYFICTDYIRNTGMRKTFDGEYIPVKKHPTYIIDACFDLNYDEFMTIDEVASLAEQHQVTIGSHSHHHDIILTDHPLKKPLSKWKKKRLPGPDNDYLSTPMNRRSKIAFKGYVYKNKTLIHRTEKEWIDYIKYDTEKSLKWFDSHLGFLPTDYCFPFNEYNDRLLQIIRSFGFKTFYNGKTGDGIDVMNRTGIEVLAEANAKKD